MTTIASNLVGFLLVTPTASGDGWLGAFMVTDERGYPLEFRATTPVRPTTVQRALWGAGLEQYVSVELCGKKLLRESARKPKLVVCSSDMLLGTAEDFDGIIARVRRETESLEVGDEERGRAEAYGWDPVVFRLSTADESQRQLISSQLQALHSSFDLVEVFDRMRAALQILAREDSRYV